MTRVFLETLGLTAVSLILACHPASAALTVSASPVTEGHASGAGNQAVFTLTLDAALTTDAVYEYMTSPDTAQENEDYQHVRGQVTIPAGQITATVLVPLNGDSWQEGTETFSLMVWPAGTTPAPSLTAVAPPSGSASAWDVRSVGVSGGNWFIGNLMGQRQGSVWTGLGYFSRPATVPVGSVFSYAMTGRWLGYSFAREYNPDVEGPRAGTGIVEKQNNPPGLLPWINPTGLTGVGSRRLAMSGDIAAVAMDRRVRMIEFYQLHPEAPARLRGALALTPDLLIDSGILEMVMAGRRIAMVSSLGVRIHEAKGPDLAEWRQIAYLPQLGAPIALEGETLLATPVTGPESGIPCIYRQNEGGPGAWGRTGILRVPEGNFIARQTATTLRGGMVLMGDPTGSDPVNAMTPGRVHRFLADASNNSWTYAGFFNGPSPRANDGFGTMTAQAGLDFISYEPYLSGTPGWAGSFAGATVTVNDDDLPVVSLVTHGMNEPSATRPLKVLARLSQRSATDVTVQWTTSGGTATPGVDYLAAASPITIPAGQDSAEFTLSILPDNEVEPVEFISIGITAATGANFDPAPVLTAIRDTTPVSIVHAPKRTLYEGLPATPAQVQCFPRTKPLSFSWNIGAIGTSGSGAINFLAQPGVDWPAASGVMEAAVASTLSFPWSVGSDDVDELPEEGSVSFDLPTEAVSANFSLRHRYQAAGSDKHITNFSTDGTTVVAFESGLENTLMLFVRSSTAPGGWERRVIPPPVGMEQWPAVVVRLSQGRMAAYEYVTGRCWFFAGNQGGAGNWGLEAQSAGPKVSAESGLEIKFDGETLMVPYRDGEYISSVTLINRGSGTWTQVQSLETPIIGGILHVHLENGQMIFHLVNLPAVYLVEFHFYERTTDAVQPWKPSGSPLLLGASSSGFRHSLLNGDTLVISKTQDPQAMTIYRHQDDGGWQVEQTLTGRAALSASRGLISTGRDMCLQTGTPDQPWLPVGNGVFGKLENGIILSGGSDAGSLRILEAGLPVEIMDRNNISFYALPASGWDEPVNREWPARVSIHLPGAVPAPVDIEIPYQTIPGGTASPGLDYRPVSGTVTMKAGERTADLSIPLLPDTIIEPSETVLISFGTPSYGSVFLEPIITATIIDEGLALSGPAFTVSVPEPASGSAQYLIPFRLAAPSSENFSVFVSIRALTATAADATMLAGVAVPVPAGSTIVPVPLTVLADSLREGTEQVIVSVTLPRASALRPQDGPITINVNIDDAPGTGYLPDSYSVAQGQVLEPDPARKVLTNDPSPATGVVAARAPLFGSVAWQGDGTFRYTPPVNFIGTDRFAYLPAGGGSNQLPDPTPWKWLCPVNGEDPGTTVPGFQSNWMQPSFNDSAWSAGNRVMGYGVLGSGTGTPLNTAIPIPASGNRFTAYFRTTFSLNGPMGAGVELEFFCDDAAIFYLNGTELGRFDNTPGSPFYRASNSFRLLSSSLLDGADETILRKQNFPTAQLLVGSNVLAVSVHNGSPSSSDLGFRLTQLTGGTTLSPVYVTMDVQDSGSVPVLAPDQYTVPGTTTPLDSHLIGGSLYQNDGLISWTGAAYDPILEVETSGSPAGAVTINKDTGHFTMAAPASFYGTTTFSYRIRDKDGWSLPALVSLSIAPTRAYDVWRQARFGGGSDSPSGRPDQDEDYDSLANLLEFALNRNPLASQPAALLTLQRIGEAWEASFDTAASYGQDVFLTVESSTAPGSEPWLPLARFNAGYNNMTQVAPGVSCNYSGTGPLWTIRVLIPATDSARQFFRLRATQERHALDP